MRFCRMSCHVPDVTSSWCTDVMSAHYPPFDFISCILFQTSWILQTTYNLSAENQITPLWSQPLILDSIPFMPSRRERRQRSPQSSPEWGSDGIWIMYQEDLMEWFDWCCASPAPFELLFPLPYLWIACTYELQNFPPPWIIWSPSP